MEDSVKMYFEWLAESRDCCDAPCRHSVHAWFVRCAALMVQTADRIGRSARDPTIALEIRRNRHVNCLRLDARPRFPKVSIQRGRPTGQLQSRFCFGIC